MTETSRNYKTDDRKLLRTGISISCYSTKKSVKTDNKPHHSVKQSECNDKSVHTTLKSSRDKTISGSSGNWKKHACPERNSWKGLLKTASGFYRNKYKFQFRIWAVFRNRSETMTCLADHRRTMHCYPAMRQDEGRSWRWEAAPCLAAPVQNAMPASHPSHGPPIYNSCDL